MYHVSRVATHQEYCNALHNGDNTATYDKVARFVFWLEKAVPKKKGATKYLAGSIATYVKGVVDLNHLHAAEPDRQCDVITAEQRKSLTVALNSIRMDSGRQSFKGRDDHQAGLVHEGYDGREHEAICTGHFMKGTAKGLMEFADHLVGHNSFARGDSNRLILLADFTLTQSQTCGPNPDDPVTVLTVLARQAKENQFGMFEVMHMGRHRNSILCPVNAVALNFLVRFDLQQEERKYSDPRGALGSAYLIFRADPYQQLPYSTHRDTIKKTLAAHNVISTKSTHIYRISGPCAAAAAGVPPEIIDIQGHWTTKGASVRNEVYTPYVVYPQVHVASLI
jgi:hypothetical protein